MSIPIVRCAVCGTTLVHDVGFYDMNGQRVLTQTGVTAMEIERTLKEHKGGHLKTIRILRSYCPFDFTLYYVKA